MSKCGMLKFTDHMINNKDIFRNDMQLSFLYNAMTSFISLPVHFYRVNFTIVYL